MLLMIDNYDSFTYNLVQYFGELGEDVLVKRNDRLRILKMSSEKPTSAETPVVAAVVEAKK